MAMTHAQAARKWDRLFEHTASRGSDFEFNVV